MKEFGVITANFYGKIGAWRAGFKDDKMKEHIRMLDWILNENPTMRDIEEIVRDYE